MVNGHSMRLAANGGFPPLDMASDRYEPQTTQLFQRILKPGMAVADVGAHIGYYTLLAAGIAGPSGRVYAFEPDPTNFELLEFNALQNGYDKICLTRKAVSSHLGPSTLYLTSLDTGRHSLVRHGIPLKGVETVETITLDSFFEGEGWPTVDLMKVDVEGAEPDVLAGMDGLLARCPKILMVIEFNPQLLQNAGSEPMSLLQQLQSYGFELEIIYDQRGIVPFVQGEASSLVHSLLRGQRSVNLYCHR
jgi:FkbM family methyltransferase